MSTYRFPLRGKIGVVRGLSEEVPARLKGANRQPSRQQRRIDILYETQPLTEEEVRNLPVAHRYSA
ncbi:MAG TPA: hypothetical protein VN623_08750 [Hyphomicrobium sp.]|jgi:hypothetical protein|uniref:hypothetical protein n=1 Tax=Hyphomicrobium sp. TaxID=82 RepID=UPI002C793227|nr:hypothetical protein [Hyphomicrobium sp.]HXE02025.1 hypothetical protein [Hyphomicrobium sp.]